MEAKSRFNLLNKIYCTGIDFNETAINFAIEYFKNHKLNTDFLIKYIFDLNPKDFISKNKKIFGMSNGVLLHTIDCLKAIDHILKVVTQTNKNIYYLIGLYHL